MKKILAITVAFIYLAITSGLVLQIHYCMDKQVGSSVLFAAVDSNNCAVCGMQNEKHKCCHDEVKFIKLQDVHQQVSADYSITPLSIATPAFNVMNVAACTTNECITVNTNSPPPDEDGQPSLFILHRLLRI